MSDWFSNFGAFITTPIGIILFIIARNLWQLNQKSGDNLDKRDRVACPNCKELVVVGASICAHCKNDLSEFFQEREQSIADEKSREQREASTRAAETRALLDEQEARAKQAREHRETKLNQFFERKSTKFSILTLGVVIIVATVLAIVSGTISSNSRREAFESNIQSYLEDRVRACIDNRKEITSNWITDDHVAIVIDFKIVAFGDDPAPCIIEGFAPWDITYQGGSAQVDNDGYNGKRVPVIEISRYHDEATAVVSVSIEIIDRREYVETFWDFCEGRYYNAMCLARN